MFSMSAFGQMSPEEAQQRIAERQAERAAAATQPDASEVSELKQVIASLRLENESLKRQVASLPEVPKAGWQMDRVRKKTCNLVVDAEHYFDVRDDKTLQAGTAGQRQVVTQTGGPQHIILSATDGSGNHLSANVGPTVSEKHTLSQLHEFIVFVNNGNGNPKKAFSGYCILANVETDAIDRVYLVAGGSQLTRGMSRSTAVSYLGKPSTDTTDDAGVEQVQWDLTPPEPLASGLGHRVTAAFHDNALLDYDDSSELLDNADQTTADAGADEAGKTQYVHGYFRKDGTYVNSYYRHPAR
jgi:hypothetical protein